MFERLCVLLVRLYPREFRRIHGPEAAQLIRDRAQHERGVVLRCRLLMDVAFDLCALSVRRWHHEEPLLAQTNGAPHFAIVDGHHPRPLAFLTAMLLSLLTFAGFTVLFQAKVFPQASAQSSGGDVRAMSRGRFDDPAPEAAVSPGPPRTLAAAVAASLERRYVDRAIGRQLADALLAHDMRGDYGSLEGPSLAARVNGDIQAVGRALGIPRGVFIADVVYSAQPLPTGPPPPMTPAVRDRNRAELLRQNCLFEKVEVLPLNVGLVKLNGFADAAACQETTARVMASLNTVGTLIIDLRDNGGGFGETALQIAGYLFDRPTFLYDPRPASPVPARTASPIVGSALAETPVYVLTSSRTQSAAEYFAYNMKMLKRATLVGQTTAGHQHSGAFHRLHAHFGLGIQESAVPVSPHPVKGWEVIGVEPDVKVSSADAFESARTLAASVSRRR